jgi:uncharacterized protein (DUF983 family)
MIHRHVLDERADKNVSRNAMKHAMLECQKRSCLNWNAMRWLMPCMNNEPDQHPDFETWPPAGSTPQPEWIMPSWPRTIGRGMIGRCPHCGLAPIFDGYLKVHPSCLHCAAPLGDMPADDAPPYIAMLAVLHVLALFLVLFYRGDFHPGIVLSVFLLVALALICMVALRMAKGAVIGVLLKLGMKRGVLNG